MYGDIDWFKVILAQRQTIERLEEDIKILRAEVNSIAANKVDIDGLVCEKVEKTVDKYDLNNNLYINNVVRNIDELSELVAYLTKKNGEGASSSWHEADAKMSRVEQRLADLNTRMFNAEINIKDHDKIIKRTVKKLV